MELPDAIDAIRPSVVQIRIFKWPDWKEGSPRESAIDHLLGSGVIVHKDGHILTAHHVVEAANIVIAQRPGAEIRIGMGEANVDSSHVQIRGAIHEAACEVLEQDPDHDLALLRMVGLIVGTDTVPGLPEGVGAANLRTDRPRDGEAIAVSGYPFQYPTLVTTSGAIASAWATDDIEYQVPGAPEGFPKFSHMADRYIADITVNGGNSGGPVYDLTSARVLGICVAFRRAPIRNSPNPLEPLSYNSGLSIIVPMRYGVELLARHVNSN
jgi:S1-C subfamily serine protease